MYTLAYHSGCVLGNHFDFLTSTHGNVVSIWYITSKSPNENAVCIYSSEVAHNCLLLETVH